MIKPMWISIVQACSTRDSYDKCIQNFGQKNWREDTIWEKQI